MTWTNRHNGAYLWSAILSSAAILYTCVFFRVAAWSGSMEFYITCKNIFTATTKKADNFRHLRQVKAGGHLTQTESNTESFCRSFLHYFGPVLRNHLRFITPYLLKEEEDRFHGVSRITFIFIWLPDLGQANLTHICPLSTKVDIGKQCKPISRGSCS